MGVLGVLVAAFALSTVLQRAVPSGTVLPQSGTVRLEVLNGCGRKDAAAQAAQRLRNAGFDVVQIGNADRFNYGPVVVVDRSGNIEHVKKVARFLKTETVVIQRRKNSFYDATVIIGHAFAPSANEKG